jgi:hypothetical protein
MAKNKCRATGKKIFRDEIKARMALGHLAAAPLREVREQRVYWCQFGCHWHLTSQPAHRAHA